MKRIRRLILAGGIGLLLIFVIAFAVNPYRTCMRLAIKEYLSSTTMLMPPVPAACVVVQDRPPAALLNVIQTQKSSYALELQSITICRTHKLLSQKEPDFSETVLSADIRNRWLPLYVGCCSYQFRRHVIVVASKQDGDGSVVAIAALVHSRWNYLRFLRQHCDEKLARWL